MVTHLHLTRADITATSIGAAIGWLLALAATEALLRRDARGGAA